MVTKGLQRNVHSAGFFVYLVETTDMQQLCAFTLAICVVVVAQRFSPGKPLASLVPRPKSTAWYTLFAHAHNFP